MEEEKPPSKTAEKSARQVVKLEASDRQFEGHYAPTQHMDTLTHRSPRDTAGIRFLLIHLILVPILTFVLHGFQVFCFFFPTQKAMNLSLQLPSRSFCLRSFLLPYPRAERWQVPSGQAAEDRWTIQDAKGLRVFLTNCAAAKCFQRQCSQRRCHEFLLGSLFYSGK